MTKNCRDCGEDKPLEAFSVNRRVKCGRQSYCKSCQAKRTRTKIASRRVLLAIRKTWTGCTDCGYRTHAEALDFDHVRGVKEFSPSDGLSSKSWSHILVELEKCEVVCANCHRHRTCERRKGVKSDG